MSPNFTEILYDIGAQDQLVGVTDFCKYPPETRKKEKVGGFYNPNIEKIVSLKPDLVLLLPFHVGTIKTLEKLHIPVFVQDDSRVQDVLDTYGLLGKKMGRAAQAKKAKARLENRLEAVRKKAKKRKPVSILFVVGHNTDSLQQIYAAGPRSFVDEIMTLAGGKNILTGTDLSYPLVSKEQLLRRNPDVIVDSMPSEGASQGAIQKIRGNWNKLSSLKAVQQNHLYFVTQSEYLIPGPTMLELAEYLSKIFDEIQK
jgi:iron complex transport system substrate-binding protein